LNAPEHQPSVAQDLTIVEFAREKMFSDLDKILAGILNQCKKALLGNSSSRSMALLVSTNSGLDKALPRDQKLTYALGRTRCLSINILIYEAARCQ
jgi:hypothetical protein